jgi:hypothetical protein
MKFPRIKYFKFNSIVNINGIDNFVFYRKIYRRYCEFVHFNDFNNYNADVNFFKDIDNYFWKKSW